MKVLTGQYHIEKPTGIFEDIHKILELPFEKDIEKEIVIYQFIRNKAFGVTFINQLRLVNVSMGTFEDRFNKRSEKILNALQYASEKFQYNIKQLIPIYRHYRLIEAEDNHQILGNIYEKMEQDFSNIS